MNVTLTNVTPHTCSAPGCDLTGQALIERYDPVPGNPTIAEPSGEWIWLCLDHLREEFA